MKIQTIALSAAALVGVAAAAILVYQPNAETKQVEVTSASSDVVADLNEQSLAQLTSGEDVAPNSTVSTEETRTVSADETVEAEAEVDADAGEAMAEDAAPADAATPTQSEGADAELAWMPSDGDVISYNVLRKGKPFGTHSVSFAVDGDAIEATTRVRLKAGIGPITAFKYELDATETWKNGKLVGVKGNVNDDGTKGNVSAMLEGDALNVKGTEYSGSAPLGSIPASHWNMAQVEQKQLLSTEDGELIKVNVTNQGADTINVAGKSVEATKYLMDSDIDVELWYDSEGRWVRLAFEARGQAITYELAKAY